MRRLDLKKVKRNTLLLSCLLLTNCSTIQESPKVESTLDKTIVKPSENISIEPAVKPEVSTTAKSLLLQAKQAQKAKQIELAISLATQAIEQQPDYVEAFQYRGFRYGDIKNYPAAIKDFKMLTRLKPDYADAWGMLGGYLILNQQFSEAQQASQKAVALESHSQSMSWTMNLGHSYLLQGDEEQAYHYYRLALPLIFNQKTFEQGPVADFELFIKQQWESTASQKALDWFQNAYAKMRPADEYFADAKARYKQRQYKQAMMLFQQALLVDKDLRNKNAIIDLLYIASCHQALQHFKLSIEFNQQALKLAEKTQGQMAPSVATSLNNLASLYQSLGNYALAKPLFLRALAINEKVYGPEHANVAASLNNLALLYENLGDHAQAKPLYLRALAINEKVYGPEHASVATNLNNLAILYESLGDYALAKPLYLRALAIDEKVYGPEHAKVAATLNNLATLYDTLGDYALAKPLFLRALAINEKVYGPEHAKVAATLNNLAALYQSLGHYSLAKPLYLRALAIDEKVYGPEHANVATRLNNLALLYDNLGDYALAKPLFLRALAIREKVYGPEHAKVAATLNNLATLYDTLGDYALAKPLFLRALAIREKVYGPEHPEVAMSFNNLAGLYQSLGDYALAKPLYLRALAINEKVYGAEHANVAASLNNLAILYTSLGDYALAKPLYLRALAIDEKVYGAEHANVATSLNNLALLYNSLGDYALAKPLYLRALAIREKVYGPEHPEVAMSFNNLAGLYQSLGDYALAKPLFLRAYGIIISSHRPRLLSTVQANLRNLYISLKVPNIAVFYGKQAVNTIQALRSKNVKLDNDLQKSFLKDKEYVYRDLANLLIDQDRLAEAEQVLSMLKEEEYFDFIRRDSEEDERATLASYTPFEQQWKQRYDKIADQLVQIGAEYSVLQQKKRRSPDEDIRFKTLQTDMDVAREAFLATLDQLETAFSQLTAEQAKAYGAKNLAFVENEQETLAELKHGAVLIHTILTEESLHLLLTTKETQVARKSSISLTELKQKIQDFRKVLKDPLKNPQPLAQALFHLLVKPIRADLKQANAQTLMWSLDGLLRYIPMAALHDGKQYLIEKYAIALYTAAARGNLDKQPTPQWKVAGLGTSQAYSGFDPLDFVPGELDGIVQVDKKDTSGVLPGVVHLNKQFTADEFKNLLAQRYPVFHIASHFKLQPGNNAASYLLLGDGTQLTLSEFNKRSAYKFRGVDLLTLSACNTAMGETGQGQEVEGFAVLAQKRGAKGVLATLWPVADQSTGQFMQNFYHIRTASPDNSKADALRQAQRDFIAGKTTSMSGLTNRGGIDPDEPQASKIANDSMAQYSHPYYWAPFILMGNWL